MSEGDDPFRLLVGLHVVDIGWRSDDKIEYTDEDLRGKCADWE